MDLHRRSCRTDSGKRQALVSHKDSQGLELDQVQKDHQRQGLRQTTSTKSKARSKVEPRTGGFVGS